MRLSSARIVFVLACLLSALPANALIISYGQRQIAEAGAGCVGGRKSDHGNTAYFRGDTGLLNEQLASLANGEQSYRSFKLVLHAGALIIDDPEEQPLALERQTPRRISVDWSVSKSCPFETVKTGLCQCDERNVTVHVWVASEIRLDDLIVPVEFAVRSAGDIDRFVKRHTEKN